MLLIPVNRMSLRPGLLWLALILLCLSFFYVFFFFQFCIPREMFSHKISYHMYHVTVMQKNVWEVLAFWILSIVRNSTHKSSVPGGITRPPCSFLPYVPVTPYSSSIVRGWYIRPSSDWRSKWTVSPRRKVKRKKSGKTFRQTVKRITPPPWSSGQGSWLQISRSRVPFPALPDFLRSSVSGTGSIQPREYNWGATWKEN
jgi:hypothetical protein